MVQVTLEEPLRRRKPKWSVWEVKGHIPRGAVKGAGKGGLPARGYARSPGVTSWLHTETGTQKLPGGGAAALRPAPGLPSLGQRDRLQLQKKTSGKDADAGSWSTLEWLPAEAKRRDSLCEESNSHPPSPGSPDALHVPPPVILTSRGMWIIITCILQIRTPRLQEV